jgi:general secretion pathway protein A
VYTKFFNLREAPFRLTPDPRFLHLAEPHRLALRVLLEGILTRKGLLVLCGPIGTGKTTLMHSAMTLLEKTSAFKGKLKTAFLVNPTLSREEFLESVLDEFEVSCSTTSKPRRLAALHEMLVVTHQHGGTAVLVVDEAHLLTPELLEEIRLLSNADAYQEKLLQVVLSGQPELQINLNHPNMRALQQRIAASCQLRALSLPETRVYVMERLHAAGLQGAPPFSGTVLEQVFTHTSGVPRLINLLCDRALSIGFSQQQQAVDSSMLEEAAGQLNLLVEQVEAAAKASLYDRQKVQEQNAKTEGISAVMENEIQAAIDLLIHTMGRSTAVNLLVHAMGKVLFSQGSNS